MDCKDIINVHDIVEKYSLPIYKNELSVRERLRGYLKNFYLDLKKIVLDDYPDDFPIEFYDDLKTKIIPIIDKECSMIIGILKDEGKVEQNILVNQFNNLMRFLIDKDAFRVLIIDEGSFLTRVRPEMNSYERKNIFHIPYSCREKVSANRFSIPNNPCLYLSYYKGLTIHNYEMVKSAWIECGMPNQFTYCIYKTQKKINLFHLSKDGKYYLCQYDYAHESDKKKERLDAVTQYLLSFPLRAACHISVDKKSVGEEEGYYEEYIIPQLLMQWLQENSIFDGISYQGASPNPEQQTLDIDNVVLPVRNISIENEYDSYLKECFKLSEPKEKDLSKEISTDEMRQKIDILKNYINKLNQILILRNVDLNHPYAEILSYCNYLNNLYIQIVNEGKCTFYEEFPSIYKKLQGLDANIMSCKTVEEWFSIYNRSEAVTNNDFEDILISFHNDVIPVSKEINKIFYFQDCGSFFNELDFQSI